MSSYYLVWVEVKVLYGRSVYFIQCWYCIPLDLIKHYCKADVKTSENAIKCGTQGWVNGVNWRISIHLCYLFSMWDTRFIHKHHHLMFRYPNVFGTEDLSLVDLLPLFSWGVAMSEVFLHMVHRWSRLPKADENSFLEMF